MIKTKTKLTYPLSSSTSVTVFVIAEKLLSLRLQNFQTFSLLLLTFCEKLSVIA